MVGFIDQEREAHGVESMCNVLPIAPSTYYRCKLLAANPDQRSDRIQRDEALKPEITRVYEENLQVYGARKVWKQLNREDIPVARCTVERLMRGMGLDEVERATLTWVEWFHNRRLLQPIGDVPPVEYETLYYQQTESEVA